MSDSTATLTENQVYDALPGDTRVAAWTTDGTTGSPDTVWVYLRKDRRYDIVRSHGQAVVGTETVEQMPTVESLGVDGRLRKVYCEQLDAAKRHVRDAHERALATRAAEDLAATGYQVRRALETSGIDCVAGVQWSSSLIPAEHLAPATRGAVRHLETRHSVYDARVAGVLYRVCLGGWSDGPMVVRLELA